MTGAPLREVWWAGAEISIRWCVNMKRDLAKPELRR